MLFVNNLIGTGHLVFVMTCISRCTLELSKEQWCEVCSEYQLYIPRNELRWHSVIQIAPFISCSQCTQCNMNKLRSSTLHIKVEPDQTIHQLFTQNITQVMCVHIYAHMHTCKLHTCTHDHAMVKFCQWDKRSTPVDGDVYYWTFVYTIV